MRVLDLFEAPIEDLTHLGDWSKNSSYREQDRKLLTNPKAVSKITAQWEKTPVNFNMYFINSPEARKHTEVGMVTPEWLQKEMPTTTPLLDIKSDAVNLLFTNNSGAERVPMTGWIIAHRFGHVVSRYEYGQGGHQSSQGRGRGAQRQVYDFTQAREEILRITAMLFKDAYGMSRAAEHEGDYDTLREQDRMMVAFYQKIGTMRSARNGQIRNEFEFTLELLAQYMLTGRIKFNPLPRTIASPAGRKYYAAFRGNDQDYDYYNGSLDDLADTLQEVFLNLMHNCVGRIFVM
jgi:hypothetical protein